MLNQRPERFTLPTAGVEHDWVGCFAFRNQSFQIVECHAYHVLGPRFRAEKPKANTGFADEFYIATRMSCHLAMLLERLPSQVDGVLSAAALKIIFMLFAKLAVNFLDDVKIKHPV